MCIISGEHSKQEIFFLPSPNKLLSQSIIRHSHSSTQPQFDTATVWLTVNHAVQYLVLKPPGMIRFVCDVTVMHWSKSPGTTFTIPLVPWAIVVQELKTTAGSTRQRSPPKDDWLRGGCHIENHLRFEQDSWLKFKADMEMVGKNLLRVTLIFFQRGQSLETYQRW